MAPSTIEQSARDTLERGLADALIVSGAGTGLAADVANLERVRRACPSARIFVGSGITAANLRDYISLADGFIVGTSLKKGGQIHNPVDEKRVAALARALR
jgi:predicted TIM-barrel enzyme